MSAAKVHERDELAEFIDDIRSRLEGAKNTLLYGWEGVEATRASLHGILVEGDDYETILAALAGGGHYCELPTGAPRCPDLHGAPIFALRAWAVARCEVCGSHVCAGGVDPDWWEDRQHGQVALCRTCATGERDGEPSRAELRERNEP